MPDAPVGLPDAAGDDVDAAPGMPDAAPAAPDAEPPGPDAMRCAGDDLTTLPSNISDACDLAEPSSDWVIRGADYVIDTDDETFDQLGDIPGPGPIPVPYTIVSQSGGPDILVVSVGRFAIESGTFTTEVDVRGSRPLMIVSFGDISVEGELRADADKERPGAGGNHKPSCTTGAGAPGSTQQNGDGDSGGTGGGGGAFGSTGGGGSKIDGAAGPDVPTAGGLPNGVTFISPLRGGCPGGAGGMGGGAGGAGGGALQLTAEGSITISGRITANGGGGKGTNANHAGGGGGGSGGAILLEAGTSIVYAGELTANGGGGGEGKRAFWDGSDGDNGHRGDAEPAGGGDGWSEGGPGGTGGALGESAGDGEVGSSSEDDVAAGGGGGGSIGRIHLSAPTIGADADAIVSPASQ